MVNGIIADPEVLEEEYIPQNIPCREVQKKELAFRMSPMEKGRKPLDCLCHGKPGTGKTALVKYILQLVNEFTNGLGFYVNCWENKTLNLILDRLVEQASIVLADTRYSAKLSRLKQRIGNKPCVIVLDEVDKLDREDLNDVIYMLKRLGKVGVVCISNTRKYVLNLDPRTISRIRFKSINFPPYSDEELLTILQQRVVDYGALFPNTCPRKILQKIADLAAGDARIAIQTLRNAAYNAERSSRSKISIEDVEKGYEEVKDIKRKYYLERLTPHHKLMVKIVKKNQGICSGAFYDAYKHEARKSGIRSKSSRTFNNYVNDLVDLGYLKVERAKTRGNVRSFVTC
jgi:orc1/cdc6 family replication initiation protein